MLKTLYRWIFWIVFILLFIAICLGIWLGFDITKRFLTPLIQTKTDKMFIVKSNSARSSLKIVPFVQDLLLMDLLLDSMNSRISVDPLFSSDFKNRKKSYSYTHKEVYKTLVQELNRINYSYTDYQDLRKNCLKVLITKFPLSELKVKTTELFTKTEKQKLLLLSYMKNIDSDPIFSDSSKAIPYSFVKEYTVESIIPKILPVLIGFDKKP